MLGLTSCNLILGIETGARETESAAGEVVAPIDGSTYAIDDTHVYYATANQVRAVDMAGRGIGDLADLDSQKIVGLVPGAVVVADFGEVAAIRAIPIDGGAPEALGTAEAYYYAWAPPSPSHATIRVVDESIYWIDQRLQGGYRYFDIMTRTRHTSESPLVTVYGLDDFVITSQQTVSVIAVDQANVYWSSSHDGEWSIWLMPLDGSSEPRILRAAGGDVAALVSTGTDLYWVYSYVGIRRARLDGGVPSGDIVSPFTILDLVGDAQGVYALLEGKIAQVNGDSLTTLVSDATPGPLHLTSDHIYYVCDNQVCRIPRAETN